LRPHSSSSCSSWSFPVCCPLSFASGTGPSVSIDP
jgi:hypothetical protein